MNNSLTVFRDHAKTSRAQLLLAQSSNSRELTRTHGKPLIALAAVPVIFFGLGVVLAGDADDHPSITLPTINAIIKQSFSTNGTVPVAVLSLGSDCRIERATGITCPSLYARHPSLAAVAIVCILPPSFDKYPLFRSDQICRIPWAIPPISQSL